MRGRTTGGEEEGWSYRVASGYICPLKGQGRGTLKTPKDRLSAENELVVLEICVRCNLSSSESSLVGRDRDVATIRDHSIYCRSYVSECIPLLS